MTSSNSSQAEGNEGMRNMTRKTLPRQTFHNPLTGENVEASDHEEAVGKMKKKKPRS